MDRVHQKELSCRGVLRGPLWCAGSSRWTCVLYLTHERDTEDLNSIYSISLWVFFFFSRNKALFSFVLLEAQPQQGVQNEAGPCLAGAQ